MTGVQTATNIGKEKSFAKASVQTAVSSEKVKHVHWGWCSNLRQ